LERVFEIDQLYAVMPALVAGIHVFLAELQQGVDGRDKPGHDSKCGST